MQLRAEFKVSPAYGKQRLQSANRLSEKSFEHRCEWTRFSCERRRSLMDCKAVVLTAMSRDEESRPSIEGPGLCGIAASVFFGASLLCWLFGGKFVVQALRVLHGPQPGDAAIGALIVAVATVAIGVPMLLVAGVLAILARQLPAAFRVISVVPGLLAVVAGVWMLVLIYI
ncbi:MAG: hypothetical protein KJ749_10485 [Planctomycetes bacterium]|nr:hypothetical protein [Planctomycetota bacterium]